MTIKDKIEKGNRIAKLEELKKLHTYQNISTLWEIAKHNGEINSLEYIVGSRREKVDYARLDSRKNWSIKNENEIIDLNRFVELATELKITGFYCNDMCFVITKNVPDKFIPYVVLHESTERDLEGIAEDNIFDLSAYYEGKEREEFINREMESARRYPHQQACIAELRQVFEKGKEFAEEYANWLKETNWDIDDPITFFNQAIPNYLNENDRISKYPLTVMIEFYSIIEMIDPKDMIKSYPWMGSLYFEK